MQKKDFENLKTAVFAKQKVLAEIYKEHGNLSLFDYVNAWQYQNPQHDIDSQQSKLFGHMEELVKELYGKNVAREVRSQIEEFPIVSTIDHHGILNHPFFINSNLIFSLKENLKFLPVLTTAGVSLNNSSWPGCLVFTNDKGSLERFSFFSDKIKTLSVWSAPALNNVNVQKVLLQITSSNNLSVEEKKRLIKLVEDVFANKNLFLLKNFSAQASTVSSGLWEVFFPKAPKLIYLPIENLVSRVLLREIIPNPNHILYKLFFTNAGWNLMEKYFDGAMGAFSAERKGSFLFWGIGVKDRRTRFFKSNREIFANDNFGKIKKGLDFSAEAISRDLDTGKMYPTSLVCFLTMLYFGVTCVGGFNQVNWLTEIKNNFVELLLEIGEKELAVKIQNIFTKNFAEGNLVFLEKHKKIIKGSGLDIFLGNAFEHQNYQEMAKRVTVAQSIETLLPEIYLVITPAAERKKELLSITDVQIAEFQRLLPLK